MGVVKLSTSEITQYQKYSNFLAGNPSYVPTYYDLLESVTLTQNATNVEFSSLSSKYNSYRHLQIRYTARSTRAVAFPDNVSMQVNSDATVANYRWHLFGGDSTTVAPYNGQLNPAGLFVGAASGGSSSSGAFASNIVDILDAFQAKNKTVRTLGGSSASTGTNNEIRIYSSLWLSTAAIDRLVIAINSANSFVTGSRFSLYGLR